MADAASPIAAAVRAAGIEWEGQWWSYRSAVLRGVWPIQHFADDDFVTVVGHCGPLDGEESLLHSSRTPPPVAPPLPGAPEPLCAYGMRAPPGGCGSQPHLPPAALDCPPPPGDGDQGETHLIRLHVRPEGSRATSLLVSAASPLASALRASGTEWEGRWWSNGLSTLNGDALVGQFAIGQNATVVGHLGLPGGTGGDAPPPQP